MCGAYVFAVAPTYECMRIVSLQLVTTSNLEFYQRSRWSANPHSPQIQQSTPCTQSINSHFNLFICFFSPAGTIPFSENQFGDENTFQSTVAVLPRDRRTDRQINVVNSKCVNSLLGLCKNNLKITAGVLCD